MRTVTIYTPHSSARLRYILHWLFTEQLHINYVLTHSLDDVSILPFCITYGAWLPTSLSISDSGLLWEEVKKKQDVMPGQWKGVPTLYATEKKDYTIPFDIFSALFFLLSRYEEYYPYSADKQGRYPATESILFSLQLLERPIVDEWVHQFRKTLAEQYNIIGDPPAFSYQATYDIDIAYSYLYKGWKRTTGAYSKDLLSGNIKQFTERSTVIARAQRDPYDSYKLLNELHSSSATSPIFFILAALKTTQYDKNISPLHPKMKSLIRRLHKTGTIGMHPSYNTDTEPKVFTTEKKLLEQTINDPITCSRQHYIKFILPQTPRQLIKAGITDDYSMGYGTHLGFRAGTGKSFLWYDIKDEVVTTLRIHPFCFMDTTAHFENQLSINDAFNRLENMAIKLKACTSKMITVFHNNSLGTDKQWDGWKERYSAFIKGIS
jgi:hypothetical protein